MEVFDGPYYKSCKWFLHAIGLWPYDTKSRRLFCNLIFCTVNMTMTLPQALMLIQKWGKDFTITFENSGSLLFACACISKYLVTYSSGKRLKLLFLQISKDWQRITDINERQILIKFYEEAKRLVSFYTIYAFCAWLLYTAMPFIPFFLDLVHPLENGTRPLFMPFYADYVLFDQHDYHYWACGHIAIIYFTSFLLYSGVDGIYVLTVKHTCGLFAITCDRLERISGFNEDDTLKNDIVVHRSLSKAVTLHTETLGCFDLLENSFNKCFLVVQSLCVVAISIAAVYILYIYDNAFLLLRIGAFLFGVILHLLYLNWIGQKIIESSSQVFDSTYKGNWYTVSIRSRKFINMIMYRSLKPCELTAGTITTLSMETFGILMKTSMSYFTVFLSVT